MPTRIAEITTGASGDSYLHQAVVTSWKAYGVSLSPVYSTGSRTLLYLGEFDDRSEKSPFEYLDGKVIFEIETHRRIGT